MLTANIFYTLPPIMTRPSNFNSVQAFRAELTCSVVLI